MQYSGNFLVLLSVFVGLASAIWPKPSEYSSGKQVLWLPHHVKTTYQGPGGKSGRSLRLSDNQESLNPLSNDKCSTSQSTGTSQFSDSSIVEAALDRFVKDTQRSKFVPWKFHPRNVAFEPSADTKQYIKGITVHQTGIAATTDTSVDESYTLSVPTDGNVLITTTTSTGALQGLNTLEQLFYHHSAGGSYMPLAPVTIKDKPEFSHRGLNLDISRNYQSPSTVKHVIDGLAFTKMNRLHIHATDSQSWPIEIPALPKLAKNGAYHGQTWSVNDLKDVMEYATMRGVQTYLEIDSPGHTAVIAYTYPDLIAGFNEQMWPIYANEPPSGQVKLNYPPVTDFFNTLYSDLLPRTKPYSSYFHSGGDELNANIYALDPTVGTNSSSAIQKYLQAFVASLHAKIHSQGLHPIVWEEMLLQWNLTLSPDAVVQTWRGPGSLATVLKKGHKAIFGDYQHWYLDCGFGQWVNPTPGSRVISPPYADYCSPYKSWREIYSYDPLANITADLTPGILGGEVHMWGELTDGVNLDGKVWPRAAAAAEVMWSGGKGPAGVTEDVTRRLAEWRERLVERGVGASVVQMTWCLQNEGGCSQ
jgi:hexosaminidase